MQELIDILEEGMQLPFNFIERQEELSNTVVYTTSRTGIVSDATKESSLVYFKFHLIVSEKINERIKKLENLLYENNFSEIYVGYSLKANDLVETVFTANKIIEGE